MYSPCGINSFNRKEENSKIVGINEQIAIAFETRLVCNADPVKDIDLVGPVLGGSSSKLYHPEGSPDDNEKHNPAYYQIRIFGLCQQYKHTG